MGDLGLEGSARHEKRSSGMVRLSLVAIGRREARARLVHVSIREDAVHVTGEKVVAEFVRDAEALEAFVTQVSGVADRELLAEADQHARHAPRRAGLWQH